ncbi:MAG TPA: acyltransferase family protein [Lachnospiraceae bacterium]|nr:acyltransferase family protein [Lachnospiraceae bacterium]
MPKIKVRNAYLDLLRLIACILIITVHVSALNWVTTDVNSLSWQIMNAYDCLGSIGVPLFVMISGALLLNKDYSLSMKDLYCNKIFPLMLVYFIWLLLYNVVNFIDIGTPVSYESVKDLIILNALLGRGIYHLWFIPMLLGLYMITPILRAAFSTKKICLYFLILSFFIGFFMPTLLLFPFPYKTIVESLYNRIPYTMLTGFIGYYVLGHYLHSFVDNVSNKKLILLMSFGLLGYITTVIVCGQDAIRIGSASTIINSPLTANLFFPSFSVFLMIKMINQRKYRQSSGPLLTTIVSLTFGIYLIHPLILRFLDKMGVHTLFLSPLVSIPILVAVVFVLSAIPVFIIQKIPYIGKYLI